MSSAAVRDPGLQPERTSLSWSRTLLALFAADVLIWRIWAVAASAPTPGSAAWAGAGTTDYLGVCALTAVVATVVLCSVSWPVHGSSGTPPSRRRAPSCAGPPPGWSWWAAARSPRLRWDADRGSSQRQTPVADCSLTPIRDISRC